MTASGTIDIQYAGTFVEQRRIGQAMFTIGRAEDNDLVLADPTVSREHARIESVDGRHVLVDVTGRGRTVVNGEPVDRHELRSGDQITIGPYTLLYRARPASATRPEMARTETLLAFSPVGLSLVDRLMPLLARPADPLRPEDESRALPPDLSPVETRLWEVASRLRTCGSNAQAAQCLLHEVMELIPSDQGQVLYPGEGESVTVVAAMPDEDEESHEPLSASVVRQVLATGQALACLDVTRDRRFRASISLAGRGASSVMAVPLIVAGRVAGTICLLREDEAAQYSAADLELLSAISQVASAALSPTIAQPARSQAGQLRRQADLPYPLVYRSGIMQRVVQQVLRVAATDATVLITGPSGSGKELIAAAMHYGSLRSGGPFVKVNCAAIPETLIESELFGHERGAFTDAKAERKGCFEQADGGTLFLDEIGDMSLAIQTRLLRALETRQIERVGGTAPIHVRVRLIAATHHHLPTLVRQGKFREDLWYRLDVVRIDLPPLKDRLEDVPLLFKTFAESFAASMQVPPVRLSEEALGRLTAYDWPGNVRQLRNLAERLTVFHSGEAVSGETVMATLGRPEGGGPEATRSEAQAAPSLHSHEGPIRPLAEARTEFERAYIRRALEETGGNITRAAELLGLARENLSRKIKQLGL